MGVCLYGNGACLQENGTSSSGWRQHVWKGREFKDAVKREEVVKLSVWLRLGDWQTCGGPVPRQSSFRANLPPRTASDEAWVVETCRSRSRRVPSCVRGEQDEPQEEALFQASLEL